MSRSNTATRIQKDRIEPCGCDIFIPFAFSTRFLFIEWHTLMCARCGKKVSAFNQKKLFYKWNKRCKK